MTLQKAIEILNRGGNVPSGYSCADMGDALKLGIEAMKLTEGLRAGLPRECIRLLPGETEE